MATQPCEVAVRSWVIFLLIGLGFWMVNDAQAQQPSSNRSGCRICHGKEAIRFERSVHAKTEIGCSTCHGGDPDRKSVKEAHSVAKGFRGIPRGIEIVELCGSCHSDTEYVRQYSLPTDQLEQYKNSVHGKRLYESNDPNVATCVDCHGGHAILGPHDPESTVYAFNVVDTCDRCHGDEKKMKLYDLPWDTAKKYRESVHGKRLLLDRDIGAPHCAACHGSHGAAPPGAKEVVNVCGRCHSVVRGYFKQSPHYAAAERGEMEECTSCHDHHSVVKMSDEGLVGSGKQLCVGCHGEDQVASDVGHQLVESLAGLEERIESAQAAVAATRSKGIFVTDEDGMMRDARRVLVSAGPVTHAVSAPILDTHLNTGEAIVEEILERLDVKRRSLRDGRIIGAILAAFCLGLMALLGVKLRRVQKDIGGRHVGN